MAKTTWGNGTFFSINFLSTPKPSRPGICTSRKTDVRLVGADQVHRFDAIAADRRNLDIAGVLKQVLKLLPG